ncbi:hypothetical protein [Streptomyces sp. NBC_00648]|uniref:hypothetical protein n=1 Tax=Streptomyces sp. NBC_00648 TaxID=2975797 RepID=UPI00324F3040
MSAMKRVCTSTDRHGTRYSRTSLDTPGTLVTWAAINLTIYPITWGTEIVEEARAAM